MIDYRDYQQDAINNTYSDITSGNYKATCLVLPTGGGKTITSLSIVKRYLDYEALPSEKILWLVHRKELVEQTKETCDKLNIPASYWTAKKKSLAGKVIVCSIQSCRTLEENIKKAGVTVRLIVEDEAHHRPTKTIQNIEEAIKPEFVLGLTATPTRMDDKELDFDKISYQITFLELVEKGYLAKPKYIVYNTGQHYKLRAAGGDFRREDLKALNNTNRNKTIAKEYRNHKDEYKKTIIFCSDIKHCYDLEEEINIQCPEVKTAVIHAGTKQQERDEARDKFASGEIDILLNVMIFTEGFDCPSVNTVMLARPTGSEVLWQQMIGRAARGGRNSALPNKTVFNIVDFADQGNKYALLAEDWSTRLLGANKNPYLEELRKEQIPVDQFNNWVQQNGPQNIKVKEKREIIQFDGIMTLRTKAGSTKRYMVKTKDKRKLKDIIDHMLASPPNGNGYNHMGEAMDSYIYYYARNNPGVWKWPGKYLLTKFMWAVYFKFIRKELNANGEEFFEYLKIPDFLDGTGE